MATSLENQPFKNREHIKAEIRRCALFGSVCQYFSFLFAALGVIGEAFNITLGLEPMSWLLLAILAGLNAINSSFFSIIDTRFDEALSQHNTSI